jgi:hypothetical protein
MPMTTRRWERLKKQLGLWFIMDAEALDPVAAAAVIVEMRNTLAEIVGAQEEAEGPAPWWRRVFE